MKLTAKVGTIRFNKPSFKSEMGEHRFIFTLLDYYHEGRPVSVIGDAMPSTVVPGEKVCIEAEESRHEYSDKYRSWTFYATSISPDGSSADAVFRLMSYYLQAHRDELILDQDAGHIQTVFPSSASFGRLPVCLLSVMSKHARARVERYWKTGDVDHIRKAIDAVVNYFHPQLGRIYETAAPFRDRAEEVAELLANWMQATEPAFESLAKVGVPPETARDFAPHFSPTVIMRRPALLCTPFVRLPYKKMVEVAKDLERLGHVDNAYRTDFLHATMLHALLEEDWEERTTFLPNNFLMEDVRKMYRSHFGASLEDPEDWFDEFGAPFGDCLPDPTGNLFQLVSLRFEGDLHYWQRYTVARAEMICADMANAGFSFPGSIASSVPGAIQAIVSKPFANGATLDESQRKAVESVFSNRAISVITGPPGTGKTTIIQRVIEVLGVLGLSPSLVAPTGKAAVRMTESTGVEAATIHSRYGYDFGRGIVTSSVTEQVVIIDEASMVPIRLLASLFESTLTSSESGSYSSTKFILVGDADQLPPIPAGQPFEDYVREESLSDTVAILDTLHRQTNDSVIPVLSRNFLNGDARLVEGEDCVVEVLGGRSAEDVADRFLDLVEERDLNLDRTVIASPQYRHRHGVNAMNKAMQSLFHEEDAFFRVNADRVIFENQPVVCKENDYDRHVMNGSMGVVTYIHEGDSEVGVKFEELDELTVYSLSEAKQMLMPAYALTVHKLQGSEMESVMVVCSAQHRMLHRRLIYTAVTRARKFLYFVYDEEALLRATTNEMREERRSLHPYYLQDETLIVEAREILDVFDAYPPLES